MVDAEGGFVRKKTVESMPKPQETADGKMNSLARELLEFRDELSTLNACNAFILQALAGAMVNGDGMDSRSATGAMFCAQWLSDRAVELEQRLKKIHGLARGI
jgi:hypothetical protein